MNFDFDASRPEERAMLVLRRLYELYGYRRYKVSNFEEYSLYLQYKKFLAGDRILSFTDLDGRLLALRPDVTLSIIKNARENETAKAYYIEKVYRESKESNTFKEINQMGLEYMGRVDSYALAETVQLAAQSLAAISDGYILEIGHMQFVTGLLEKLDLTEAERAQILAGLAAKSPHLLKQTADELGLAAADAKRLLALLKLTGSPEDVLNLAEDICTGRKMQSALDELKTICAAQDEAAQAHVRLDLAMLNDTEFYDGILICGYLEGVPRPVLSGGRYDSMMRKLGHSMGAVGFAVYLDELERLPLPPRDFDVDVWLEEDADADAEGLLAAAREFAEAGQSVRVAASLPSDIRFRRHYKFSGGRLAEC